MPVVQPSKDVQDSSPAEPEDWWRETYFPHLARRRGMLVNSGVRLVHYTTGQVACSILERREIWMRNASTMNDFKEVEYGLGLLAEAWKAPGGEAFRRAIENTFAGMEEEIPPLFNSWQPNFRSHTYLTCVSEHDEAENHLGRLSMWRAYGGDCGVALVLAPGVTNVSSEALRGMYAVPVLYGELQQVDDHLGEVASNIAGRKELIHRTGREQFKGWLFQLLRLLALSTKHPGFQEEREWRVTYSPHLGPSPVIRSKVEAVRGTPQLVFKIPLEDQPEHDVRGLDLPRLVQRIIVGPTQHPHVVADALRHLLQLAGDQDASSKVVVSDIPLRHL